MQTSRAERVAVLFQPFRLRNLTVTNRFVMSAMSRNSSPNGIPTDELAQYFRRRVDGEVGLIIAGGIGVDSPASCGAGHGRTCAVPVLHGDEPLAGWQRLVDLIHAGGGKIAAQLWHMGVMYLPGSGYHPDAKPALPSGTWGPTDRRSMVEPEHVHHLAVPGEPLTDAEIVEIVAGYGRSARNAKELGFDAITVHGGNGYLPDSFMWDETNRRTDRWGGNRRERTRFAVEIVKALRSAAGDGIPIFWRFTQWKHQDRDAKLAHTPAELEDVLGPLSDAGVDVFDAAQFKFDTPEFPGSPLNLAGWAKKLTGKPSVTIGAIGLRNAHFDPEAEQPQASLDNLDALLARFERGEFDLVALGRSLLNDPQVVHKIHTGQALKEWDPAATRAMT
jgi:2,4-dienoyl-CoA reductase-like NADH-dependent reductase (Old Yellow Enzyme family)